jgi:hypothetical protein
MKNIEASFAAAAGMPMLTRHWGMRAAENQSEKPPIDVRYPPEWQHGGVNHNPKPRLGICR